MTATVHDPRPCELGEGALWHPGLGQLFWVDILGKRLLTNGAHGPQDWIFDQHISALGWVDERILVIASENAFFTFDLITGQRKTLTDLEADRPATRSNDGRADPWGGFWIGTMGKGAEPGAGAIYRYYQGTVHRLFAGITIPNAICFAPDRSRAYFADTTTGQIQQVALNAEGWPEGDPTVFVDLRSQGLNPDGAVVAADGTLWNAQWGAFRVAGYHPDGSFAGSIPLPAAQISCPALGGPDGRTLYATSAREGLSPADMLGLPLTGQTFAVADVAPAQPEPQVILP